MAGLTGFEPRIFWFRYQSFLGYPLGRVWVSMGMELPPLQGWERKRSILNYSPDRIAPATAIIAERKLFLSCKNRTIPDFHNRKLRSRTFRMVCAVHSSSQKKNSTSV
jgi:hypothetical protein